MSSKENKQLDKLTEYLEEERDKRSMELFNKHEIELQIAERAMLEKYIHDYQRPVWRRIMVDNEPTNYKVSNLGMVRNTNTGTILTPTLTEFGYLRINLCINSTTRSFKAHRLVAQAFIPNPENKREVNHISCIKTCNWVGNLEWATSKENKAHARAHGLYANEARGQDKYNVRYTDEQIHKVCKLLEEGYHVKEIADMMNIPVSCPMSIKYNGRWKHISCQYKLPKPYDQPAHRPNTPGPSSKLTEDQVHNICKLISDGKDNTEIANIIGAISSSAISAIRNKRVWNYISDQYTFPDPKAKCNPIVYHRSEIESLLQSGETDPGAILEKIGIPDSRQSRKYIGVVKFKLKKQSSTTIDQQ